jgi:hypothetical protein
VLVLAALRSGFAIRPGPDPAPGFGRLELAPRTSALPALAVEGATEALPLDLAWLPNPREPGGAVRTSPDGERAFRYEWSAWATTAEEATVDLLLGGDGRVRLSVDGETVSLRESLGFSLWRDRVRLAKGRHALALAYETRSGSGRLVLQAETPLRD